MRMTTPNAFNSRASLGPGLPDHYRLAALATSGLTLGVDLGLAPVTLKILLENALRHAGGGIVREEDVATLSRVILQASPACRRSWTWRRCATRWRPSAAIPPASTRWCPRTS
jgi:hypothetical protein